MRQRYVSRHSRSGHFFSLFYRIPPLPPHPPLHKRHPHWHPRQQARARAGPLLAFIRASGMLEYSWPAYATRWPTGAPMLITHVMIHVKPEHVEAFKAATLENARNSVREPGIARFDVIQ